MMTLLLSLFSGESMQTGDLTPRLANGIAQTIRGGRIKVVGHLDTSEHAERSGVSLSPVLGALQAHAPPPLAAE